VAVRDGSWDLEALGRNVGRLETTGAHPNDALAMALVGHITLAPAQRGPFADLQHIPRDGAVVYAVDGLEYHYTVRSVRRLEPDDVESLYVHDGRALLLLTCTDWDPERRIYASRLLVTAELVQITEGNGPQ
jgi:LPXTG-site transpeptidase (sortase) family protein